MDKFKLNEIVYINYVNGHRTIKGFGIILYKGNFIYRIKLLNKSNPKYNYLFGKDKFFKIQDNKIIDWLNLLFK